MIKPLTKKQFEDITSRLKHLERKAKTDTEIKRIGLLKTQLRTIASSCMDCIKQINITRLNLRK